MEEWVARKHPEVPEAHMNCALGYRRLGRHAQAARSFEGALQAAVPDWPHRAKVENSLRKTLVRIEAEGR